MEEAVGPPPLQHRVQVPNGEEIQVRAPESLKAFELYSGEQPFVVVVAVVAFVVVTVVGRSAGLIDWLLLPAV